MTRVPAGRTPACPDRIPYVPRRSSSRIRRWLIRTIAATAGVVAIVVVLFVINGLWMASGETPTSGVHRLAVPATGPPPPPSAGSKVRIMAYNIAKGFAIDDELDVAPHDDVEQRLQRIADVINREQPDLVFLAEVLTECGPCRGDHVQSLIELTDLPYWAFGENMNFGLPFYRFVSGNAILSRWPLQALDNPSLPGRKPFYVLRNNRRVLYCTTEIAGERVMLASIHNNTYDDAVNLEQVHVILDDVGGTPAILAGDFNARPSSPSIKAVRDSQRFAGMFDGPPTFRSNRPSRTIDYIFAPASWELLEHHTVCDEASDHCAVVSTFRVQ